MLATTELKPAAAAPPSVTQPVARWLRRIPLYHNDRYLGAWDEPGAADPFRRLPLMTKADIRRDFPRNFLGAEVELEDLLERDLVELEHTSGTSEERTPLLLGAGWWNEQEERALRLNPLVRHVLDEFPEARRVTLSSPVCSGDICYRGVPTRSERVLGNALFVSLSRLPFLWSEGDLARIAAEAREWEPQFLDVDPVYGVVFARYCERHGIRLPSLQFILASYEFVSVTHRRVLERVFRVPVFNLYGSTETGHLLMEDTHGRMRPSEETAFLEVIEPDAEGRGELVVTTLTNEFMPLIRYRIGDLVERHQAGGQRYYTVHGRSRDALRSPDGRRVTAWQVDQCFAGLEGVAHYQLLEEPDRWRLRFVPDAAPCPSALPATLRQRLALLLGVAPERLTVEPTDLLLPESSGKFRLLYPARRAATAI